MIIQILKKKVLEAIEYNTEENGSNLSSWLLLIRRRCGGEIIDL